jgi:selenocysteine-specific elongation factor
LKQIILGTAGHIDHGKTSLIKAVTGINTDRLKEEQVRGITIELGFASLALPSGQKLGIVDVPGHEKFVKNMVAGATGIDIVALVIAADEGIMPQTREHMEICSLLDIKFGLVVLTKVDLVDEEWLELVKDEVTAFVRGTFLENAPVIPVSSSTGQGLPDFIKSLDDISKNVPIRRNAGLFRLPVDRVFTMKGFGTVITGTLIAGKVAVGDQIMLYPSQITSKVRGVQVHGESVPTAMAGMRTAINFQGLDKTLVNRGDIVATPSTLVSSHMVDVSLNYLAGNTKKLKNRTRVRFHSGTSEIMGIVVLLDREDLTPGETALAQIRLETPVSLIRDDRYVLRSYSPVRTIGGGRIINPIPAKHKPNKKEILEYLSVLTEDDSDSIIKAQIQAAGFGGCTYANLRLMVNLPEKQLDQALQIMLSQQTIIQIDKETRTFIHQKAFSEIQELVQACLTAYHAKYPLKPGIPKEELKTRLPGTIDSKTFLIVVQHLIKTGQIVAEEDTVRLARHKVALAADQKTLRKQILTALESAQLSPPYFKDFCHDLKVPLDQAKEVLALLINEGLVVKIKEDLYYHQRPLEQLKQKLVDFLITHEEISTPQFKDMTGASRKFVIPLIEFFDSTQVTIRVGDIRKLRRRPGHQAV